MDIENVSIFTHPILSLKVLAKVGIRYLEAAIQFCYSHLFLIISVLVLGIAIYMTPGPHQPYVATAEEIFFFAAWWIMLGVASSIGLGTGLHTFVLYLGPHIAGVTLVAYACNYVPNMLPNRWTYHNFEDCPVPAQDPISIWTIIFSVQLESFLWGFGTALGELPPYFIARAARMANRKPEELEDLEKPEKNTLADKAKLFIAKHLKSHGFITVMLMASIPNPLFDLAGLMCGHFGISLWIFLGSTMIGKAIFKVHIQMIFTVFLFSQHHVEVILHFIEELVPSMKGRLSSWLEAQQKLLRSPNQGIQEKPWFAALWEVFIILMIAFFFISILNNVVRSELAESKEEAQHVQNKKKPKKE